MTDGEQSNPSDDQAVEVDLDQLSKELSAPPSVQASILLADAAQVQGGKLFVLGGGWTTVGPRPQTTALALRFEVPWDRANIRHRWSVTLVDADGRNFELNGKPLILQGEFEAGRPAGHVPGVPLATNLAATIPALPLAPGQRYTWVLAIDGESRPHWRASFTVRANPQPPGNPI